MKPDNALVNSGLFLSLEGGDTGRGRAEHRNFLQLWFTHYIVKDGSEVAQLGKFVNMQILPISWVTHHSVRHRSVVAQLGKFVEKTSSSKLSVYFFENE